MMDNRRPHLGIHKHHLSSQISGFHSAHCRMCGGMNLDIPEQVVPDSIILCLDCGAGEKCRDLARRVHFGEAYRIV